MEAAFTVCFSPDHVEEYFCELVVVTEREKFAVPVRARGREPRLDIPPRVTFNDTAVRSTRRYTLHLTNVGSCEGRMRLNASPPFSVQPRGATVQAGESIQCVVSFNPTTEQEYLGSLDVSYDRGKSQRSELVGNGKEMDISLSPGLLEMPNTFVHTSTTRYIRVANRGWTTIQFKMKRFATEEEDEMARNALLDKIYYQELVAPFEEEAYSEEALSRGSTSTHAMESSRQARYDALVQRALDEEMLFDHEAFEVEPVIGEVLPGSEVDVAVTFAPQQPQRFEQVVSCEVMGKAQRLPLAIRGQGIGPKVMFSFDALDFGECYIHATHQAELEIKNRGEIQADFEIHADGLLSSKKGVCSIEPSSGSLPVGGSMKLTVSATKEELGNFHEVHHCYVEGAAEPVPIEFRGRVVGPSFALGPDPLNFGQAAFGFTYSKDVRITNNSDIPMRYRLRVPEDEGLSELSISPAEGSLLPGVSEELNLTFCPRSKRQYRYSLVVDVPGVGAAMRKVLISADCPPTKVRVDTRILDFGTTFLRASYAGRVNLINDSLLPAKFRVTEQDDLSRGLAVYTADPMEGTIPVKGSMPIDFNLSTERLGAINLPVSVHAFGCPDSPLTITLQARSQGPQVHLSTDPNELEEENVSSLDFGRVQCLKEACQTLYITNTSPVRANVRAFVAGKDTPFFVDELEMAIEASGQRALSVRALLDDNARFTDTLHILVTEGPEFVVRLEAMGIGTALAPDADISHLDFGTQFKRSMFGMSFTVVNQGRRGQSVSWINEKLAGRKASRTGNKEGGDEPECAFYVTPDMATIEPDGYQVFKIHGSASEPGKLNEVMLCKVAVGRSTRPAFRVPCEAEIAPVELWLSNRQLDFHYFYSHETPPHPIEKTLDLKNVSALPISFTLKTPAPFSVSPSEVHLDQGATATVSVTFDAAFTTSRQSATHKAKLQILFPGIDAKEQVDLLGYLSFPNLEISEGKLNFGAILNDTIGRKTIRVKNISLVDAEFSWHFHQADEQQLPSSVGSSISTGARAAEAFSIVPAGGVLKPGEEQPVEVSFYAHQGFRGNFLAICSVEGGPRYELSLSGESSSLRYTIDQTQISIGRIVYNRLADKELTLTNNGRVGFDFSVDTSSLTRPTLSVIPQSGHVEAGERQVFRLWACPGAPGVFEEYFHIEVAHLEPELIQVSGEGITPLLWINLPRLLGNSREEHIEHAKMMASDGSISKLLSPARLNSAIASVQSLAAAERDIANEIDADVIALRKRALEIEANEGMKKARERSPCFAEYLCDFGHTIRGTSKTKRFKIVNISELTVTVNIDRKSLKGTGVSIDSDSLNKLQGAPDHQAGDVTLGFDTSQLPLGQFSMDIPINLRHGPHATLAVRANVTVPKIIASAEVLEFGEVPVGCCKRVYVQLSNVSQVVGDWSIQKPPSRAEVRDWHHFKVEPRSGQLQPGQRVNVAVDFVPPSDDSRVHFQQKLPLRVVHAESSPIVRCTAQSSHASVRCDVEKLSLGALLPSAKEPNEALFALENASSMPVEVVSLDFDKQYLVEEEMLSSFNGYDEQGVTLMPPRNPGDPIWEEVAEAHRMKEAMESAAQKAAEEQQQVGEGEATSAAAKASDQRGVGELETPAGEAAEESKETSIERDRKGRLMYALLIGPHQSGKTTQARRLSERYGVPLLSADDAVWWVLSQRSEVSQQLRKQLGCDPVPNEEMEKASHPETDGRDLPPLETPTPKDSTTLTEDQLSDAISARLTAPDAANGAAFDGNSSRFAASDVCARAILRGCGLVKEAVDEAEEKSATASAEKKKTGKKQEKGGEAKKGKGSKQEHAPLEPVNWAGDVNVNVFALEVSKESLVDRKLAAMTDEFEGGAQGYNEDGERAEPDEASRDEAKQQAMHMADKDLEAFHTELDKVKSGISTKKPIFINGVAGEERVLKDICKHTPYYPGKENEIPDPEIYEIVRKPSPRQRRQPVGSFKLLTPKDQEAAKQMLKDADTSTEGRQPHQPPRQPPKKFTGKDELVEQSRWKLDAHSSVVLLIRFSAEQAAMVDAELGFETRGGRAEARMNVSAACEQPSIIEDSRNVFYRKTKSKSGIGDVNKQYVLNRGRFEFGPLLASKKKILGAQQPNAEHWQANEAQWRMTNDGHFPIKAKFSVRQSEGVAKDTFSVEPQEMRLDVEETADLTVRCFPAEEGTVEATVYAQVEGDSRTSEFRVAAAGVKPSITSDTERFAFDRLLMGHQDSKTMLLRNPTLLPIKWRLRGAENLPEVFALSQTEGVLKKNEEQEVKVTFSAEQEGTFEKEVVLEVTDGAEILPFTQKTKVPVKAEAYNISVDIAYPDGGSSVDFGVVKALEPANKSVTVTNKGKYEVGYAFSFRSRDLRELITVSPTSGNIQPGSSQTVEISFNKHGTVKREVTLKGNKDLELAITEPLTGAKEKRVNMRIDARSVFSKYIISPSRGLNFGPHVYNTSSSPRKVVISNHGEFAFDVALFKYGVEDAPEADESRKATREGGKQSKDSKKGGSSKQSSTRKGREKEKENALEIGNFKLWPPAETVEPGSSMEVNVVFEAESQRTFTELVGIDVGDRDPSDHPGGIPYEIAAESCIPGINADDVDLIFEEHEVTSTIDPLNPQKFAYARSDNTFSFGPVLARLPDPNQQQESQSHPGAQANLRIGNPNKVQATVNFSIKPRQPSDMPADSFPMDVQPRKLDLPPHEHRYCTLIFTPKTIQTFMATFEASVEHGADPKTKSFKCEIRGDGTLPHIAVHPNSLEFPSLLVGRSVTYEITISNNGLLPALVRASNQASAGFTVSEPAQGISLEKGEERNVPVAFTAEEEGEYQGNLSFYVRNNPFEHHIVNLRGHSYKEDVTLSDLPGGREGSLVFEDSGVGITQSASFEIVNMSEKTYKFSLPAVDYLTFSPSIGHLFARNSKRITASFSPSAAVAYRQRSQSITLQCISYQNTEQPSSEWDNGKNGDDEEPQHKALEQARSLPFKLHAVADNARYELEQQPITFRPTMMFQKRSYSLTLTNTCNAIFRYTFSIYNQIGQEDDGPYIVDPREGTLEAGASVRVTIKFAPEEVVNCSRTLRLEIPHLDDGYRAAEIKLDGKVLRPWCHFELPENDYLAAGRRDPSLPGPNGEVPASLDPLTKVVEIESLGTKVKNTKRFFVLNPTSVGYDFSWEPLDGNAVGNTSGPFRVPHPQGTIGGGKKYEMVVEYTPGSEGLCESFWAFNIHSQGISVPFLFVGRVSEPDVKLSKVAVNFSKVLVGAVARETVHLVNNENTPFNFAFDKATYDCGNTLSGNALTVEPESGTLSAKASQPLRIALKPGVEQPYNFNVACNVRRKPSRLTLNVKGEGYAIHESIELERPDEKPVPLTHSQPCKVDLGRLFINETGRRTLRVANSGALALDCRVDAGDNPRLEVEPSSFTVSRGERETIEITYRPRRQEVLEDHPITIQVVNGRRYKLLLNARAQKPGLTFSKHSHDFGLSFVQQPGLEPAKELLEVANADSQDLSFDVGFQDLPHLSVQPKAAVLSPGQKKQVELTFTPPEEAEYKEVIPVEVNGLYTVHIQVKGEGTPLKLELVDIGQKTVNLGALRPNQKNRQEVKLANRSRLPVEVSMQPNKEALAQCAISAHPPNRLFMRSKQVSTITLTFNPTQRARHFSRNFVASVNGVHMALFRVEGACLGLEASLTSDSLPFGTVVLGSKTTKRVQLQNTGDIGTTFRFDHRAFKPHFSVSPSEGAIPAGQETAAEVTFCPADSNSDISASVPVHIDGVGTQTLTVTGSCMTAQQEASTVEFRTPVRTSTSKSLTLTNNLGMHWRVTPSITSDFWSGPERVDVAAGESKQVELTFAPQFMASAEQPHEAIAFFPRPDGSAVVHRLRGIADQPNPEGNLQRQAEAKQGTTEILDVRNWLPKAQRFRVSVEAPNVDPTAKFEGADYMEVPSLSTRQYRLRIVSHKEGTLEAKVYFTEESSGEYLFYNVRVDVKAPPSLSSVPLHCPVRQKAVGEISLDNPLDRSVTASCSCDHLQVFAPEKVEIPSRSSTSAQIAYRPVVEEEKDVLLTLSSNELGKFPYTLRLSATAPGPEQALSFTVPLGRRQSQPFKFVHYLQKKAEYSCTFSSKGEAGFECDKSIVGHPAGIDGVPVEVEVTFEPTAVGEGFRDTLIVSHPEAGEYTCPLYGRCTEPKPQGPFQMRNNACSIPFKNVFPRETVFHLSVDNSAFSVNPTEKLPAKRSANLSVSFKDAKGGSSSRRCRLTVTAEGADPSACWVFYIQA